MYVKSRLKEFVTTHPGLQGILDGILWKEEKISILKGPRGEMVKF